MILSSVFQSAHFQLIVLTSCFLQLLACPFSKYEDALISESSPLEFQTIQIPQFASLDANSFSLGFWSLSISTYKPKKFPFFVEWDFEPSYYEDGQLLLLLNGDIQLQGFGCVLLDWNRFIIIHQFRFYINRKIKILSFEFPASNYEGQWLFTLITFNVKMSTISIQITGKNIQTTSYPILDTQITYAIGGRGCLFYEAGAVGQLDILNLNYFKGRLSKLFISNAFQEGSENFFDTYQTLCQIPKVYEEEQTIFFVKGLKIFEEKELLFYQFNQYGNNFCVTGWVKYDFSNLINYATVPLIRITTNRYYGDSNSDGDYILFIEAVFYAQVQEKSNIQILAFAHQMPFVGQPELTPGSVTNIALLDSEQHFQQAMTEWHFLKYEYRGESENKYSKLQMLFSLDVGLKEQIYYGTTITNTMYYVFVGMDDFLADELRGSIYDLKFQFYYEDEKDFSQMMSCHFTCNTCDGPFENNCLTCMENSNRKFLKESKKCECQIGYLEKQTPICQSYQELYKSLVLNEIEIYQPSNSQCLFGYFELPNQGNLKLCIQCPQHNYKDYLCLDCLFNFQEWYIRPVCTKDYILSDFFGFETQTIKDREVQNFDVYFISLEGIIQFHPELYFCDEDVGLNCFFSKFSHLDTNPYVSCKPNYFQVNGECTFSDSSCLKVNNLGICELVIDGKYYFDGKYSLCPSNCLKCKYENDFNLVYCEKCVDMYTIVNGICTQCGQFCQICKNYYDKTVQSSYLKCYSCIDNSKYFISFDSINCQENTLLNCAIAFQSDANDVTINTLDIDFPQRKDMDNVVTLCARCKQSYFYLISDNICIQGQSVSCDFGYTESRCDIPIDDTFIMQTVTLGYYSPDGGASKYNIGIYDDESIFCTTYQQCLIFESKLDIGAIQFYQECPYLVIQCSTCLKGRNGYPDYSYICLICEIGYYSERISGKCQSCPSDIFCQQCYQQQSFSQDHWKENVRVYYKQFIEQDNVHPFIYNAQSQNIQDYEVKCSLCISGYELYQTDCIKSCSSQCLECQIINKQNICIKCAESQQGRTLSLFNNECIECPQSCALCRIRSNDEIKLINPLFNNSNYFYHSHQCLKSYQDKKYYFDSFLNTFIDCDLTQSCIKQFIINLNLICSKSQFQNELDQQLNDNDKQKFQQENIFIDDLVSGNSFQQFENDYFYFIANQKQIKQIIIEVNSNTEQICLINTKGLVQQQFSQNIFTAIDIQFKLTALKQTTFRFEQSLTIQNFQSISIKGFIFEPIQNSNSKTLIFSSVYNQNIELNTIVYQQNEFISDQSAIKFNNINRLLIENFTLQKLYIKSLDQFLIVNKTQTTKQITITNFKLLDSILENLTFLDLLITSSDTILLNNFLIQSQFINSSFLQTQSQIDTGSLSLKEIQIKSKIQNSILLNLVNLNYFLLEKFSIVSTQILNSTIILLNNNADFQEIFLQKCYFGDNSLGIANSQVIDSIPIQYKLVNLQIYENEYFQNTKFLQFQRFNNQKSKIQINQFQVLNNFCYTIDDQFNVRSIRSTLFYFEVDNLDIKLLSVDRGYGLSEFSIVDAINVQLESITIKQGSQFKFLGIHQYLDCQLQQVKGQFYLSSIRIQSCQVLQIKNLFIKNTQSYNSPIISYTSADILKKEQFEKIVIINANIANNLLLLTKLEMPTSLIKLESEQKTEISLINMSFQNNLLIEYIQDDQQPSSLLLYIDSYQGQISLQDSQFKGNSLYNSSDNIIHINTQEITINDCKFDSNGLFNYNILQPYLLWGYSDDKIIYLEDIENIFIIKSTTGNGYLSAQNISMINCNISNSQGTNGGCFKLKGKQASIITIEKMNFQNVSNSFLSETETGGCLQIDSTTVASQQLTLKDIYADTIYSRYQGGLVFINSDENEISALVSNIVSQDVYSQIGAIFCFISSKTLVNQQKFIANSIAYRNTRNGIIGYYDSFYKTQISNLEIQRLANNMSLIYMENVATVIAQNIEVLNLQTQSLLYAIGLNQITISRLKAYGNMLGNSLIKITPNTNQINTILIDHIEVEGTQVGVFKQNYSYQQPQFYQFDNFFKCLSQGKVNNKNQIQEIQIETKILEAIQQLNYNPIQIQKNRMSLNLNQQIISQKQNLIIQDFLIYNVKIVRKDCYLMIQSINDLRVYNSVCGTLGCINIAKNNLIQTRILNSIEGNLVSLNFEVNIRNYFCKNNQAQNGPCLNVNKVKVLLDESDFSDNNASNKGGAIQVGGEEDILITKSKIANNQAQIGGGIYFQSQTPLEYYRLGTIVLNNSANQFGNDILSIPQKLTISMDGSKSQFSTIYIENSTDEIIEQIYINSFTETNGMLADCMLLPSGQKISEYQFFDWKYGKYVPFNKTFRIVALNRENEIMKNLSNTSCNIKSRLQNISLNESFSNDSNQFLNNYTSIKTTQFNQISQDYNLDDLIIYFDSDSPLEIALQLEIDCTSIQIPIINNQYPYNILGYHNNYKLRVNIRTYQCQFGEIKNETNYSCQLCDSSLSQFSLQLNKQKCDIKDDISTISVQSAKLNLREGYWRPYFDSSKITYCLNLPENCLGGWIQGDSSCFIGHLGGLCEQCDLYNIRGDGQFSVNSKYSCGSCTEREKNALVISFVSIWTLISILISVQSTLKAIEECVRIINIMLLGLEVNQDGNQSAILIKILTNYFQIISAISTFQLSLPSEFTTTINAVGSPIQAMLYSLDCFLSHMFDFEIQYARMVWQLIMPFMYISAFFLIYFIGTKLNILTFNKSVITTTLIYMYIYLQPSLVGGLVELLSFREISGYQWISANVAYRYDTQNHLQWILKFCFPSLLVLALLIPLYFFYGLYSNFNNLDDKQIRLQWGYLYNEYKKSAYFWEIIKIIQKELMIIFLTYYAENIIIKASIMTLILVIYLQFNLRYKPFNMHHLNKLDYYATNICIKSMILAIGIYAAQLSQVDEISIIYFISLSLINLYLVQILLFQIILHYVKQKYSNYDEKLDGIRDQISRCFPFLNSISCMKNMIKSRTKSKLRVKSLYQKLKQFLLPQAKQIIAFKQYQWLNAMEKQMEQNEELIPISLISPTSHTERQQFIRKTIREKSLKSRHTITSYILEKIKFKRVDNIAALYEQIETKKTEIKPSAKSAKFPSYEQNDEKDDDNNNVKDDYNKEKN